MAPRTFWKGYLKLSLVTCPVAMEPARTAGETLRFHTVNRETGNRVESRYVDSESGMPVGEEDQAKGYEIEDHRFVILEDEELEAVGLESTRTIDIERFVPREDVSWIWLDRPHLLKPGDKVGEEAFAVIREAMVATGTAAVSRLVLYRREHAVALVPRDELTERNIGALHEIDARKGPLVVITHAEVDLGEIGARRIDVPRNEPELDPILLTIPLQLLAYHAAQHLGHDIDKPRNLAKSVTVE